jgi:hypothetical protein
MKIGDRLRRLEVADPAVSLAQSYAAFIQWAAALNDVAARMSVRAETEEDRELLVFVQENARALG